MKIGHLEVEKLAEENSRFPYKIMQFQTDGFCEAHFLTFFRMRLHVIS